MEHQNTSEEEDLYGGLSIKNEGENSQESQQLDEEKLLDAGLKIVTQRIRSFAKQLSNESDGTILLGEVFSQIGCEKENKEKRTEKKLMQDKENTIEKTEKSYSAKSRTEETVSNPPVVLDEQSLNLEKVNSHSMNLLDSSAKRLHDSLVRMLPVKGEDAHNEMMKPDNHTIQVACHVAHEITNLMRLKLDVAKFAKTFEK